MESRQSLTQRGTAMLIVLFVAMALAAVGVGAVFTLDRWTAYRAAYQRGIVGFYAAEAGLNYGAAVVMEALLSGGSPHCVTRTLPIGGRIVTYRLAGCGQTPVSRAELDPPFEGLSGTVYTYIVDAGAASALGIVDAHLTMQFQVHVIPVLQFAGVSPTGIDMRSQAGFVFRGPVYSGGDVYLGDWCPDGQGFLGQVIAGGSAVSGNSEPAGSNGRGGVSTAGSGPQGATSSATTGCLAVGGGGGGVTTGIRTVSMPNAKALTCTPWSCPGTSAKGTYWSRASIRIVLDTTTNGIPLSWGEGPALHPITIVGPDGLVDSAKTAALRSFMMTNPGAITYSDVPLENRDCRVVPKCEVAYASPVNYATFFPSAAPRSCLAGRNPRDKITAKNYCYDYRYGGFFNWREGKPILMLNVDWGALEKWNAQHNGVLFSDLPGHGDLIAFLSVKGRAAAGANNYGVRVFDAARLQGAVGGRGVTLVSDVAAYVVGDYNCPTSGVFAAGTQGCQGTVSSSVVADTVNLLSCAWIDESDRACGGGDDRPATAGRYRLLDERSTVPDAQGVRARETHANAAFVGGSDATVYAADPAGRRGVKARSNDGLQNFIGLHENWGGQKLVIEGSIINLGVSQHTCSAFLSTSAPGVPNDPTFPCGDRSVGQQPGDPHFGPPFLEVTSPRPPVGAGSPPFAPLAGFITRDWLVEIPLR